MGLSGPSGNISAEVCQFPAKNQDLNFNFFDFWHFFLPFSSVFWFLVYETLLWPYDSVGNRQSLPKIWPSDRKVPGDTFRHLNDIIIIRNGWSAWNQSFVKNCTFQPKWTNFDRFNLAWHYNLPWKISPPPPSRLLYPRFLYVFVSVFLWIHTRQLTL